VSTKLEGAFQPLSTGDHHASVPAYTFPQSPQLSRKLVSIYAYGEPLALVKARRGVHVQHAGLPHPPPDPSIPRV
jgi:hypothetical protein